MPISSHCCRIFLPCHSLFMIYMHLSWIKPTELCLYKWPVLMSLGIKMAPREIEIIFWSPCLVSSVMDCVYRIWIQPVEKLKESSLITGQLTSYHSWCDTRRRTQHHLCAGTAKMFHLNLIMRKQSGHHTFKDILHMSWPAFFKGINVMKDRKDEKLLKIDGDQRDRKMKCNAWASFGFWIRRGKGCRGHRWEKEVIVNLDCIFDAVESPECDNCVRECHCS